MEGFSCNEVRVHSSTLRSGFGLQGIVVGGGLFWIWFHTQTEQGTVIYGSVVGNIESKDKALSLSHTAEDNCVILWRTTYPVTNSL
jgi:hypothetical protein